MSTNMRWLIAIGKATLAIIGAAGAVACILVWLKVEPKDVRTMTWPHWLWLIGALILFGISLTASLGSLYRATRKDKLQSLETEGYFKTLADEDSVNMSKRLLLCGKTAKLNVETVEPYIDVTFKIVNTSMFSLMSEKVEGNAFYRGYSGDKCYLSRTPIIADILNVFHLSRGDLGELTLRLFVPLEITDNIAAAKDRLEVDFSEVRVYFRFNGTGGNTRFSWFGDAVEVGRAGGPGS
jgi:hypothetical protein